MSQGQTFQTVGELRRAAGFGDLGVGDEETLRIMTSAACAAIGMATMDSGLGDEAELTSEMIDEISDAIATSPIWEEPVKERAREILKAVRERMIQ